MLKHNAPHPDLISGSAAQRLKNKKHWLIGVSGGPDSMALWHGAHVFAKDTDIKITAVTVDHGLRANARTEAQNLALFAQEKNWSHHIITWEGPKPSTRLQERARSARYELMCDAAHRLGADALLTAHHADDQIETILFRLSRGSGPSGLAGMADLSMKSGLEHHRPLLNLRKAQLIDYCHAFDLPYVTDPSNQDPRFARTQARQLLPLFEKAGMQAESWLRLSHRASRAEQALSALTAQISAQMPASRSNACFALDLEVLKSLPAEVLLRIITQEIQRINKNTTIPRLEQSEAVLEAIITALEQRQSFTQTLAQCLISLSPKAGLCITPAPERQNPAPEKPTP